MENPVIADRAECCAQSAPVIVTMGCPAGIGPEIIVKHFAGLPQESKLTSVVAGDAAILSSTAASLGIQLNFAPWSPGSPVQENAVNVLQVGSLAPSQVVPGKPDIATAEAMAAYIIKAVELCQKGFASGIATCPISKTALNNAGYNFPGHTEFLRHLTSGNKAVMMMAGKKLTITLATVHCSLQQVPSLLSQKTIIELIEVTDTALRIDFNKEHPKIAVAGLNPHAGEDGLFGDEEERIIAPAIAAGRKNGVNVQGPFPPDTVFHKAASGIFDGVICMYHDQGLIPFKLLHFDDGVNVTLGLDLVRTSVDHGTAYDIAGKGVADSRSLSAAIRLAAEIAGNRSKQQTTASKTIS